MRPIQLLSGKVLGIGLVAMGQAATVLVFALILAEAVGSDVLHGAEPVALAAALVWLLLGYTFYCWVYAAAGSMAERQDQVQTLALPLSLPMIVGYVIALTAASSGEREHVRQGTCLHSADGAVRHAGARRIGSGPMVGIRHLGPRDAGLHGGGGPYRLRDIPASRVAHWRQRAPARADQGRPRIDTPSAGPAGALSGTPGHRVIASTRSRQSVTSLSAPTCRGQTVPDFSWSSAGVGTKPLAGHFRMAAR